jgi:phage-related tail protein
MAARKGPSQPNISMSNEHRTKIQNSQILKRLIGHVEGTVEMTATQVSAGLGLLRKVLPDLAASADTGREGGLTTMKGMTDIELEAIAAGSSNRASKAQESPNVLN